MKNNKKNNTMFFFLIMFVFILSKNTSSEKREKQKKSYLKHNNKDTKKKLQSKFSRKIKQNLNNFQESFIYQNEPVLLFLTGIGVYHLQKKYRKPFLESLKSSKSYILYYQSSWTILHTLFLIGVNTKGQENIKNIFIPFKKEYLNENENWLNDKLYYFPILSRIKEYHLPIVNEKKDIKIELFYYAKKHFYSVLFFSVGILSNIFKQPIKKKILFYVFGQELILFIIFLLYKKNRNLKEYKYFLLDHLNPTAEIQIKLSQQKIEKGRKSKEEEKNIKISPFLNFMYAISFNIQLILAIIIKHSTNRIKNEFKTDLKSFCKNEENSNSLIRFVIKTFNKSPMKNRTTISQIKDILENTATENIASEKIKTVQTPEENSLST